MKLGPGGENLTGQNKNITVRAKVSKIIRHQNIPKYGIVCSCLHVCEFRCMGDDVVNSKSSNWHIFQFSCLCNIVKGAR